MSNQTTRYTPGNYVPLDVNYARDIAIRKAGPNAELLFLRSLAYAKGALTSGFVSDFDLEVVAVGMRSVKAAAEKLVEVTLWVRVSDGWLIRSWERWNAGMEAISAGGKLGNHTRWHVDRGLTEPTCDLCTDRPQLAPDITPDSPSVSGGESQGKGREGKGREELPSSPRGEAEGFAEFYDAYPRKTGRKAAATKFAIAARTVDPQHLIDRARDYAADPNQPADRTKIPHPATWLHQGRWDDEPLPERLDKPRTLPAPGERLPGPVLDDLLGLDLWCCPPAPAHLDDAAGFAWQQQTIRDHQDDRQRLARQRMGAAS